MRRGVLKPKSSFGKFAKTEEHARWAIRRMRILKLKAFLKAQGEYDGREEHEANPSESAQRREEERKEEVI